MMDVLHIPECCAQTFRMNRACDNKCLGGRQWTVIETPVSRSPFCGVPDFEVKQIRRVNQFRHVVAGTQRYRCKARKGAQFDDLRPCIGWGVRKERLEQLKRLQ